MDPNLKRWKAQSDSNDLKKANQIKDFSPVNTFKDSWTDEICFTYRQPLKAGSDLDDDNESLPFKDGNRKRKRDCGDDECDNENNR